jgi:hypothetical protein
LIGKALAPALGWFSRDGWRLAGKAQARLDLVRSPQGSITGSAQLDASQLSLAHAGKRSEPIELSAATERLQLDDDSGWIARSELSVHAGPLRSLVPLVISSPLDDVASTALDLQVLEGRIAVELGRGALRVRVINARSGRLQLSGYLDQRTSQPLAAFLFSSGPLHVGVTLRNGETEVSPFVGAGWLAATWPRLNGRPGAS